MQSLEAELQRLKEERGAVILAHNYTRPEVQDNADFVGDSLDLSRRAAETDADVILFCGVHFMAETAAILCPDKKVLVPDPNAGCPMADMISVRELRELKQRHPSALVVTYVNSTAEIKAESDICCTSANAVQILATLPPDTVVIFVPDKYLADYASRQARRKVIPWQGYCPTHARILPDAVDLVKKAHPAARLAAHPECRRAVLEMADEVASTSGILRFCRTDAAREFIIATEIGILHRLRKENPGKTFYPASEVADCPNMKLATLEKMVWSLEDMEHEVTVPPSIAARARRAIERMLELS